MKFFETDLKGSYIIELEKLEDHRGFFTRIWDKKIFQDKGLNLKLVQTSFSFNKKRGTLRGIHFQKKPFGGSSHREYHLHRIVPLYP